MLKVQGTTRRNGVFYCQFWCGDQLHRKSLQTDSARQAQQVMKHLYPFVDAVRSGKLNKTGFNAVAKQVIETRETDKVSTGNFETSRSDIVMIEKLRTQVLQILGNLDESTRQQFIPLPTNKDEILQFITALDDPALLQISAPIVQQNLKVQIASNNATIGYEAIQQIADGLSVTEPDGTVHVFLDSDPDATEAMGILVDRLMLESALRSHADHIDKTIHKTISDVLPLSSALAASDVDLTAIADATCTLEAKQQRVALATVSKLYDTSDSAIAELHKTAPDLLPTLSQHVLKQNTKAVKPLSALKALVTGNHDQYFTILNETKPEKPIVERVIYRQPIEPVEKPVEILLFSQASADFILAYKEKYRHLGKPAGRVPKYETYRKKVIAVSGDFNVHTAKRSELVNYLTILFDFPHLNKSNQFNTKMESFGYKGGIKPQEWFDTVASKIPDLIDENVVEPAAADVDSILDFMQSVYVYLRDKDIIETSPLSQLPKTFLDIKKAKQSRRGAYVVSEMKQIVSYLSESDSDLKWPVLLMIYTGCRNSEVYRIQRKQINLDNLSIFIAGTKTDNAIRDIPISQRLIELGFLEFIENMKPEQYILSNCASEFHLNCRFSEILETIDIHLLYTARSGKTFYRTLYSVRKSFSTFAKGDANRKEILLGHSIRSADRPEDATYAIQEMMLEELEPLRDIVNSLPY